MSDPSFLTTDTARTVRAKGALNSQGADRRIGRGVGMNKRPFHGRQNTLERARRVWIRECVVAAINAGRPLEISEQLILSTLQHAAIQCDQTELRRELRYLADKRLIAINALEGRVWLAKIFDHADILLEILTDRVGLANGITAARIARKLKCHKAAVPVFVSRLREKGIAVCRDLDVGYYIAATADELAATCNQVRAEAMRSLNEEANLRHVALADLLSQIAAAEQRPAQAERIRGAGAEGRVIQRSATGLLYF